MLCFLNLKTTTKTIAIVLLVFNASLSVANPTPISQKASAASNSNQITASGGNAQPEKDGLVKRNVKVSDTASAGSAKAKSYDPPPEYYRGPNSAAKTQATSASDITTASFVSKPVSFPDSTGHTKYNGNDLSQKLANTYDKWQQLQGQGSAQDRISVKHFGGGNGDAHGLSAGYTQGTHSHYIDYGGGHGAYYGGGVQSAEVAGGIPFDVYGGKGSGQYAGNGGEYSYTYPEGGAHEPAVHKDYHHLTKKDLLAKSFLIPLAGAAVLGIAAAFISHPWLLQLGAVSGAPFGATILGKRRRRDLSAAASKVEFGMTTDDDVDGTELAYRAHQPTELELE